PQSPLFQSGLGLLAPVGPPHGRHLCPWRDRPRERLVEQGAVAPLGPLGMQRPVPGLGAVQQREHVAELAHGTGSIEAPTCTAACWFRSVWRNAVVPDRLTRTSVMKPGPSRTQTPSDPEGCQGGAGSSS